MAKVVDFNVKNRTETGKHIARTLRRDGSIPGVVYGGKADPHHVQFSSHDFQVMAGQHARKINLIVDGEEAGQCVIRDVQRDPVTDNVLHVDFLRLSDGHPVRVMVPVEIVGSPESIKVGGTFVRLQHKLQIRTAPEHLPDTLKIEVTHMEHGESILVRDLSYDHIEIMEPDSMPICRVNAPRVATT